jgi:hypothetical protein
MHRDSCACFHSPLIVATVIRSRHQFLRLHHMLPIFNCQLQFHYFRGVVEDAVSVFYLQPNCNGW